jgi:23S rRNA (uracil1939-C5)-methyltransferase
MGAFMPRRRCKRVTQPPQEVLVEGMNHDGSGVATIDGKKTFIHGALPNERVIFSYHSQHSRYDEGLVLEVLEASSYRAKPRCDHYMQCGGCSLQHMAEKVQIVHKQTVAIEQLLHFGGIDIDAANIAPALVGVQRYGYRRKAHLGVRYVTKKGRVLVGFRERNGRYLTDMNSCAVLHPDIANHIDDLSELVGHLEGYQSVPQIELSIGDNACALIFRHLLPLSEQDIVHLKYFGRQENLRIYLQPGGEETVHMLWPEEGCDLLHYTLAAHDVTLYFNVSNFVQANAEMNAKMIDQAIEWLGLTPKDNLLDLFCGIGNFSVPMARYAGRVTAVEGCPIMAGRVMENARANDLSNIASYMHNLMEAPELTAWFQAGANKVLLDPPRSGAAECVPWILSLAPESIVYISCNQATFARDAGLLKAGGYELTKFGMIDMFPHTSHSESMALFTR